MKTAIRIVGLWLVTVSIICTPGLALELYVAPGGDDGNPGTKEKPLATLHRARDVLRARRQQAGGKWNEPVTVYLRGGTHYLARPLVLAPEDSGSQRAPVRFAACDGETPVISGAVRLKLRWLPYRNGIVQAEVPGVKQGKLRFGQLFVNGRRQHLARYPDFPGDYRYNGPGGSADALSPERVKRWKDPAGGLVHGLSSHRWGSLHFRINGVSDAGKLKLAGGDQINRDSRLHGEHRFVENVFEELDAPGEWFLDTKRGVLYFLPPAGLDLAKAKIEAAVLKTLIELRGSADEPVRHVHFRGLTFTHTARTMLERYENLLRGDWSIVRAGAVIFEGAEDCSVEDSRFDFLGGNGVFMSNYNRRNKVSGCKFTGAGDSAVCLVGDFGAVRSGSTWQNHVGDPPDKTIGPRTPDYPAECLVHDNLIHDIGQVGKQTAGVLISMAAEITVSHNTIYNVPRAGICINDGTWGGHLIEDNDAFATVRETGDHGPFNSWGRDRHWRTPAEMTKRLCKLDNFKTTVIRHNRFAHHGGHSWGIDLDDGSSNYHLYNNLCLGMSFKLREGFFRLVENNVCIGPNPPGFHVWYEGCDDVIRRNIIVHTGGTNVYEFIRANPAYAKQFDNNLFFNYRGEPTIGGWDGAKTLSQWQAKGFDRHSLFADPMFVDPVKGDYRVRPGSPALKLGFKNFSMDDFGVLKPEFRAEAEEGHRQFDRARTDVETATRRSPELRDWLGAKIKNLLGPGELSAAALAEESGVLMVEVADGSEAAETGFQRGDVILQLDGQKVHSVRDLQRLLASSAGKTVEVIVYREQKRVTVKLTAKK